MPEKAEINFKIQTCFQTTLKADSDKNEQTTAVVCNVKETTGTSPVKISSTMSASFPAAEFSIGAVSCHDTSNLVYLSAVTVMPVEPMVTSETPDIPEVITA